MEKPWYYTLIDFRKIIDPKYLKELKPLQRGVKKLVTSCPCCLSMLRNHWERLYGDKLPFEILHTTEIITYL